VTSLGTAQASTDDERHVAFLSQLNWSELLIGPCHVALSLSSDGKVTQLSLRSLTVDLTFKDASLISPGALAQLFDIASLDRSNGG